MLLRQEISTEQDIANALNNSGQPWTTQEYTLNYTPGISTYDLNATDIGRILFVVRLTGNPYIPALPVPYSDLARQHYGTIWNTFYGTYNGWGAYVLPETIEQMAFFRTGIVNQQCKVSIQPMPQESAQYIITYLVGAIGDSDPLESSIALPEFATLGQLRNAVSLLNYSEWFEDFEKNRIKRGDLAKGFEYQLGIKEPLFADYKRSLVHAQTQTISDWND